ncbi:Bug family tripartite tricarboxylate transporter substrate binding protein [Corynebacterium halotolerans]|uniref:Bug family tripartite tricarboxylate transporter substrate binding protein n=1 Tax=Corynebacterium halotolerans TaxID=225326 RepID=UPI003CF8A75D
METTRQHILRARAVMAVVVLAGLLLSGCQANAQSVGEYPSKRVQLLVGYGAGGANDTTARSFGQAFEEVSGETMLVVNRPGAGGIIGATEAMLDAPDGHRLFLAPIAAFTSAPLQQDVRYGDEDFRSFAVLTEQPLVMVAPADSPYDSIEDLAEAEGPLTHTTFGEGHMTQLVAGEVLHSLDVESQAIPFDGSPSAVQSVVNGESDLGVIDITSARPRVQSGDLKALAVTGPVRAEGLEDAPTVTEAGFPEADYVVSQALVGPADVPDEIAEEIEKLAAEAVKQPVFRDYLETTGSHLPDSPGPEWMTDYVPAERNRTEESYDKLGVER